MNQIRLSFEAYKKSTFGGKQDKILSVFQTRVKIYFSEKYILGFNQFLSKGNWGVYTHRGLLEQLSSDMDPRQYARHGHSTTHLPIYLKQAIHEAVDSRNCSARILYADLRRVSILSITIFEKRTGLSKNRENVTQVVIETCLYHRFIDEIIETCIAIHVCKGLVKKYRGEGAFGNVVDKKHIAHPLPAAQKWLTHP